VYHTGVEIGGVEYAFGGGTSTSTGVWVQTPKINPQGAKFKTSIYMGECLHTGFEKENVISKIRNEFPMNSYHFIHNNCNNFSKAFVDRLCGSV
jgi:hypothetical protein